MKFIANLKTILCALFILSAISFTYAAGHISSIHTQKNQQTDIDGGGTVVDILGRSIRIINTSGQSSMGGSTGSMGSTMTAAPTGSMFYLVQKNGVTVANGVSFQPIKIISSANLSGDYCVIVTTSAGTDIHEIRLP